MIIEELNKIGLNKKQAQVYLACLELSTTTVLKLSQKTGLNRTTIYKIVNELVNMKMIIISVKGKKKKFVAEKPEKIKLLLKEKINHLNQILPELNTLINKSTIKPKLKYLEGIEGIKTAYNESLNSKEAILRGFSGVEALTGKTKTLEQFWKKQFIPKRKELNKFVKLIVPDNKDGKAFKNQDEKSMRQTKLVPESQYNFKCEIFFYDNILVFISYTKNEEFALTVESQSVVDTARMIWQICWNSAY